MTKYIFLILSALPLCCLAQVSDSAKIASPAPKQSQYSSESTLYETMPEFPGGQVAMMQFIQKNIQYPPDAVEQEIEGRVYVQFTVDTLGNISDVVVKRSVFPSLDKEAVRVVKLMPQWKPGTSQGKSAKAIFNLPINFKLM